MRRFSFDLDGTLVDTQELNQRAYAEVGVTIPTEAWGRPWHKWLPEYFDGDADQAAIVHSEKVTAYLALILDATVEISELPPAHILREVVKASELGVTTIITSSSYDSTIALLKRIDVEPACVSIYTRVDLETRLMRLHTLEPNTVYIDDHLPNVAAAREYMPHLHVLHYTGQTQTELYAEIRSLDA